MNPSSTSLLSWEANRAATSSFRAAPTMLVLTAHKLVARGHRICLECYDPSISPKDALHAQQISKNSKIQAPIDQEASTHQGGCIFRLKEWSTSFTTSIIGLLCAQLSKQSKLLVHLAARKIQPLSVDEMGRGEDVGGVAKCKENFLLAPPHLRAVPQRNVLALEWCGWGSVPPFHLPLVLYR